MTAFAAGAGGTAALAAVAAAGTVATAGAIGAAVVTVLAPGLPQLLGMVGGVIQVVVRMCEQANANRAQCAALGRRYKAISSVLAMLGAQEAPPGSDDANKIHLLELLHEQLEQLRDLVENYSQKSNIEARFGADAFNTKFMQLDAEISRLTDMLQLAMLGGIADSARQLLASAPTADQIVIIDVKLDEANAKLDALVAERAATDASALRRERSDFVVSRFKIPANELAIEAKPFASGGFADVYAAKWLGQAVVAKVVRLSIRGITSSAMRDFTRELEVACDLRHPGLVTVFGAVFDINPAKIHQLVLVRAAALLCFVLGVVLILPLLLRVLDSARLPRSRRQRRTRKVALAGRQSCPGLPHCRQPPSKLLLCAHC